MNTFGEENRTNSLRTSEGWRELKKIQTPAGVVGYGYEHSNSTLKQDFNRRILQYATLHLWHGTCAVTTCPMAMTDGAAKLLRRHFDDPDANQPGRNAVFRESYRRLISLENDQAWTSGQWMTERSGGSNVRGTETVARRMNSQELQTDIDNGRDRDAHGLPLGPWLIDGFKWFSSATDADMAVLLAQTHTGLSAFYAPLRRCTAKSSPSPYPSETNGVRIQRLKNKLGTKGVPTAELELRNMRAYLIGAEGQGIKEITSILNITRLHTASAAVGYLARGLAVSRAFTRIRQIREGQLLRNNAQHLSWMATETVKYRASAHFVFFGVALLGATEQSQLPLTKASHTLIPQTHQEQENLLRLLTPVMKAQSALLSVSSLRACMESLGGVGYCENNEDGGILNIARLFRDAVVGTIWEGTTSVLAEDVLRVVKSSKGGKRNILDAGLGRWVRSVLEEVQKRDPGRFATEADMMRNRYGILEKTVRTLDPISLQRKGRDVLDHIEAVVSACLLMFDAAVDGDEIATEVARRWVRMKALPGDLVRFEQEEEDREGNGGRDLRRDVEMDGRIFLRNEAGGGSEMGRRDVKL